jgi:hypothetical protein
MLAEAASAHDVVHVKSRKVVDAHDHISRDAPRGSGDAEANAVLPSSLEEAHRMIRTLQQSLRSADQAFVCLNCSTEPRNALLLPCAHLLLCKACAVEFAACPECSVPVQEMMDVMVSAHGYSPTPLLPQGNQQLI